MVPNGDPDPPAKLGKSFESRRSGGNPQCYSPNVVRPLQILLYWRNGKKLGSDSGDVKTTNMLHQNVFFQQKALTRISRHLPIDS